MGLTESDISGFAIPAHFSKTNTVVVVYGKNKNLQPSVSVYARVSRINIRRTYWDGLACILGKLESSF